MAAILKVWRQIENPTSSIDAHLLAEQSYQISSRSDFKRRSPGLFEEVAPIDINNKMSGVMRSVPDLKF